MSKEKDLEINSNEENFTFSESDRDILQNENTIKLIREEGSVKKYAESLGMESDEMLERFRGLNLDLLVDVNSVNEGVLYLVRGYLEFARYVLINRVLPNLYDGLKPVQRYILWAHRLKKGNGMHKNSGIVSDVMEMHPHGDATIYQALIRMADSNGSFMVSLLEGQGNLGKYYKKKDFAAHRYTDSRLNNYAEEMFVSENVAPMIKSPDYSFDIPANLTPSYPYLLCASASSGIGVGASTLIPTFNVNEVLGLVSEYLTTGDIETDIVPDFSSGGSIIKNTAEIKKLMKTGKAKLRLRGDIKVRNKELVIDTFPEGVTVESLVKELSTLRDEKGYDEIKEIEKLSNKHGGEISIATKRGTDLGQLINVIYNKTSLERNYNANMLVVAEENIIYLGVHDIIKKWVAWRKSVITEELQRLINKLNEDLKLIEPFVRLIRNDEDSEKVLLMIARKNLQGARDFMQELLGIDESVAKTISKYSASSYAQLEKQEKKLASVLNDIKEIKNSMDDEAISKRILKDMARVKAVIGDKHPRKTEETNQVFKVTYINESELLMDSEEEVYYLLDDSNNLTKYYNKPSEAEINSSRQLLSAKNGEQLIGLTNNAEVIRIYGDEISVGFSGRVNLLSYAEAQPHSEVYFISKCDGSNYLLTHSNGYISYFKPDNFKSDKLRIRLLMSSVHTNVSNLIGYEKLEDGVDYSLIIQTQQEEQAIYSIKTLPVKSEKGMIRLPKAKGITVIDYNLVPTEVVENMYEESVVNAVYNFPTLLNEGVSILLEDSDLKELINNYYETKTNLMEQPEYIQGLIKD